VAAIYCVDVDPLKAHLSMWHVPARRFAQASARLAVGQITRFVRENNLADPSVVAVRRAAAARAHDQELAERAAREHPRSDGVITAEYLTACGRSAVVSVHLPAV
jgi:acetolactate synthase-1/2/3 large subunit